MSSIARRLRSLHGRRPAARQGAPMPTVTSRDGTSIFYDRLGDGPPVVLVTGGSVNRTANAGLAAELAGRGFTAYNYDRRGRGPSGDTRPTPSTARSRTSRPC